MLAVRHCVLLVLYDPVQLKYPDYNQRACFVCALDCNRKADEIPPYNALATHQQQSAHSAVITEAQIHLYSVAF